MSSAKEIWENLSAIDCSKHVKQKGNLHYLSWAWAWAILMNHYPDSEFEFLEEKTLDNGTVECICVVTIAGVRRKMWLPVMDYKNQAIEHPDSREISDSRMRCLVKTLALFGLGHSLYAGEDLPDPEVAHDRLLKHNEMVREWIDHIVAVKSYLTTEEYGLAYEACAEIDRDVMEILWLAPSKGGIWTTQERSKMKSDPWNAASKIYHGTVE